MLRIAKLLATSLTAQERTALDEISMGGRKVCETSKTALLKLRLLQAETNGVKLTPLGYEVLSQLKVSS